MYYTTLNKIKEASPCARGWNAILNYVNKTYPDDEPIAVVTLLDAVGLLGAVWALRIMDVDGEKKAEFMHFCESSKTQEEMAFEFIRIFGR